MDMKHLHELLCSDKNNMVFFDMDGVAAVYERHAYVPDNNGVAPFADEGLHYFRSVSVDEYALEMIRMCIRAGIDTYLLSKADPAKPWIRQDKHIWAKANIPEIPAEKILIAESDKAETVMVRHQIRELDKRMILVDDFNPNLDDWESAGGTSIKYLNGVNNPRSWAGAKIFRPDICPVHAGVRGTVFC